MSFDPNVRLEMLRDPISLDIVREVYKEANILMPGISELKMITGEKNLEKAVKKAFAKMKGWSC